MKLTRRSSLIAAGLMPLAAKTAFAQAEAAARAPAARGGGRTASPAVQIGAAPSLPDKSSFPSITGTYLNAAGSHPPVGGGVALSQKALAAEMGDASGFRPDQNRVRGYFAKLINADLDEITFVPNTSIGESFVCSALGLPEKGAHVVSDVLHFVGSQYMYEEFRKRGVEVTWVQMKDGAIPMDALDKAIVKGKTRLVAISAVCFVNGFHHDLKRVCEIAHAKGALVHADIIQAAGAVPIDVKDSGLDSASCATYKWLMAPGTAFLYVSKAAQAKMRQPFWHHSQLVGPPDADMTTHAFPYDPPSPEPVDAYVFRPEAAGIFSQGYSPSNATLAGLEYSLPYIMAIGPDKILAYSKPLTDRLKVELSKKGYKLMTPVENRSAIVSCAIQDAKRLAPLMQAAQMNVTLRWNHLRVATSVYNDHGDIDKLLAAMPKAT